MINKIDKLYNDLQKYIYHILFETNYLNKFSLIRKKSYETKNKAAAIIKAQVPKLYNSVKKNTTHELIDLKFKKLKNLKGEDEIFIAKETRDIDNRLTYIHSSIMFFIEQFLTQDKKANKLLEKIAVEKLQQIKVQNLVRKPIDFTKTNIGKETKRQVRMGLTIVERTTRTGWKYRANFTLKEIEKKIKEIFLDMFGDIDFVAIRTKSGKIRKYTVKYYVRMIARTETTYIKNMARIQSCKEWGCDLVQASQHANPCPICVPHEGEIYSLSGRHPIYPPLDLSWMHPNCAHGIDPYSEALGVAA